jgi:TP901 family phage tail tape measure protein
VLKAAAMGAKVGNADLGVVSDATTTIMTDFGLKSSQASVAVNTLIATVANGKTTMNALAGSLSQILPTASAAKIGLNDTMAAMATMTGEGVPAADAATYLRQTIMALIAPSKQTVDALTAVGLSSTDVATEMQKSLPDALAMITDAVGEKFPVGSAAYVDALKKIAGGSKQMQGLLDLTGDHMATFQANVKNISAAVDAGGNSITGWNRVQGEFNQQMDKAKAVGEAFLITLGMRLLPIFGQVVANIMPVIQGMMDWENRTHGIEIALNDLISAIGTTISVGEGIVSFFQRNQAAMIALGITLTIVAGIIGGILVAAMVAWTIATWGAVVAQIALLWPFMLIGAAIALLIVGIVLLWTHWSQVSAWLQAMWSATATFFVGLWNGIAGFFQMIWGKIVGFFQTYGMLAIAILLTIFTGGLAILVYLVVTHWTQIVNFLTGVWDTIRNGVGGFFSALGTLVQAGLQAILQFFINIFTTIGGWFVWLYNHNYYFKDLVDFINNVVKIGLALLQQMWQDAITWLTNLWGTISGTATKAWNAAGNAISGATSASVGWLQGTWNTASGWLGDKWNGLTGKAQGAWAAVSNATSSATSASVNWLQGAWNAATSWLGNKWATFSDLMNVAWKAVSGVISGAWNNYVAGPLGNLWNQFSGWFGNLAGQFVRWGQNMLTSFIKGLENALGGLKNSLQNIGNTIASWLGFHSPTKEGEGRYIVDWGQNMIKGFVSGMVQAQPILTSQLAQMISAPGNISYGGSGNAGAGNAFALSGNHTIVVQVQPVAAAIHVDGKKLGETNLKYTNREVRLQGGYRGSV